MGATSSKKLEQPLSCRQRQASSSKRDTIDDKPQHELKLLILGLAGSGKTTIFKQMNAIHTPPNTHLYTVDQRRQHTRLIQLQCIRDFVALISQCTSPAFNQTAGSAHSPLSNEMNTTARQVLEALTTHLQQVRDNNSDITNEILSENDVDAALDMFQNNKHLVATMNAVWRTESVQKALEVVSRGPHVMDSTQQFLDRLDEILSHSYTASDSDILLCYSHTKTMSQCSFAFTKNCSLRLIDVGGHELQRRSWAEHFTDVDAIIYVVAMNEYNHINNNNNNNEAHNNMLEAVRLFRQLCECPMLESTSMIVVMNKWDLFEQKIDKTNLNACFPDFTGVCDASRATSFLTKKFASQIRESTQSFVAHTTCALSTSDVKSLLSTAQEFTICQNVLAAGII